jgi:hypothetical protein
MYLWAGIMILFGSGKDLIQISTAIGHGEATHQTGVQAQFV